MALLHGVDASVTVGSVGALFRAFTYSFTQSVAEAVGFGQLDATARGSTRRASGTLSGITTDNASPGHAAFVSAPASVTLTFKTGCTLAFSAVLASMSLGVDVEQFDSSGYSFTRSGATTETWPSS